MPLHVPFQAWVWFNLFVLVMLALDLGVFHRKAHEVSFREAMKWSVFWIALALLFNAGLWYFTNAHKAMEFLTGYIIEKSLSVDNLFIFYVLFSTFKVKQQYQHMILFWGILGALVMRGLFIAAGVTLIQRFHWTIYIFGLILIVTGVKMALKGKDEDETAPEANKVIRVLRKIMPVSDQISGSKFFVRTDGRLMATPLFVVLLTIEMTDVIFAVDSIPAVLAITIDPFIVYTSNVFAILGLRALYFAIAGALPKFHYLHYGLSALLVVVGLKMLISSVYKIPIVLSLGITVFILAATIVASVIHAKRHRAK